MTNLLQNFDFLGIVIFRCKNICGISTENCVLCSFELEKDLIFRICAIRMDLRVKSDIYSQCGFTFRISFCYLPNQIISTAVFIHTFLFK